MATRREELTREAARLFADRGFHGTSMGARGAARSAEGLAVLADRLEAGAPLADDARGRSRVPRGARRGARGRACRRAGRSALRGHLRVVSEQLDVATVFTREWRYLEGGTRRDRGGAPALRGALAGALPRGRGVRRAPHRSRRGRRDAARPLGGELGVHVARAGARHGRARGPLHPRSSSTGSAATRLRASECALS